MKALQTSSLGSPTDVVELTEIEPDDHGPGQLAVAIEAAQINPAGCKPASTHSLELRPSRL